jgi:hypothetical protein
VDDVLGSRDCSFFFPIDNMYLFFCKLSNVVCIFLFYISVMNCTRKETKMMMFIFILYIYEFPFTFGQSCDGDCIFFKSTPYTYYVFYRRPSFEYENTSACHEQ